MAEPATTTNGNAELIEFLQEHFSKIDDQFEDVKEGLKKANARIDGLYTLIRPA